MDDKVKTLEIWTLLLIPQNIIKFISSPGEKNIDKGCEQSIKRITNKNS